MEHRRRPRGGSSDAHADGGGRPPGWRTAGWLAAACLIAVPCAAKLLHDGTPGDVGLSTAFVSAGPAPADGPPAPASEMEETLRGLLASRPSTQGVHVAAEHVPGDAADADDVGGAEVLVDTPAGPGLLRVDVRRSSAPCATTPCRRTTQLAGDAEEPASLEAVVDAQGVQVRVRAWAAPRERGPATLDAPPLTLEDLTDLASDGAWR